MIEETPAIAVIKAPAAADEFKKRRRSLKKMMSFVHRMGSSWPNHKLKRMSSLQRMKSFLRRGSTTRTKADGRESITSLRLSELDSNASFMFDLTDCQDRILRMNLPDSSTKIDHHSDSFSCPWNNESGRSHDIELEEDNVVVEEKMHDSAVALNNRLVKVYEQVNCPTIWSNHVMVNRERLKQCMNPLHRCKKLDEIAKSHAEEMARIDCLYEVTSSSCHDGHHVVHVDKGHSVEEIHNRHMMMENGTSQKRKDILNPKHTYMGMGIGHNAHGCIYLCQIFYYDSNEEEEEEEKVPSSTTNKDAVVDKTTNSDKDDEANDDNKSYNKDEMMKPFEDIENKLIQDDENDMPNNDSTFSLTKKMDKSTTTMGDSVEPSAKDVLDYDNGSSSSSTPTIKINKFISGDEEEPTPPPFDDDCDNHKQQQQQQEMMQAADLYFI